jgi:predicted flap endonuclease-1-like 5' DNA nuclease
VKRFLCFVILLLGVVAAAVIVCRLRGCPAGLPAAGLPEEDEDEPAGGAEAPAPAAAEDLTQVWGIGPVYRARLAEVGITTFAQLAAAGSDAVVAATGVPPARAADWIAQAAARAAH